MSRSPFQRSPRSSQDRTSTSHSHSHSSSALVSTSADDSLRPALESRREQSMSMEWRNMRRMEIRREMEESHYLACRARARNYSPPVDFRSLDYVSEYDNNLMCAICRCPFIDPVVLTDCDHCFCRDCIHETWNTSSAYTPNGPRGDCPTCRTPARLGPRSAINKILVNMTDELMVKCPNANHGCKAEVTRGELQDHINIYCGYALVGCLEPKCELPMRRKDVAQGCLHYDVSCLSCRKQMQKWKLEDHWRTECPDRKVECELCKAEVFCCELQEHNKQACPATNVECQGAPFGCTNKSKSSQAEIHARACPLAKLAPVLTKQQERLDEQEAAQKEMVRKLEVFEKGFTAMQSILCPPSRDDAESEADFIGQAPLPSRGRSRTSILTDQPVTPTVPRNWAEFLTMSTNQEVTTDPLTMPLVRSPPHGPAPDPPGPRPSDLPEPFTTDFDLEAPSSFSPDGASAGPYASPLHHLLSMHEGLRDEISRMSSALSELDGRHSMQILNENLRNREEITYLGAQVGGLQRQMHWLTSAQLQRQQVGRSPTPGSGASANAGMSDAGAGAGVEAAVSAVNTAATALRGAARIVNGSGREGTGMRRGPSEEGRTKL